MYFSMIISSPLHLKPQMVGDGVLPHAPPSRASSPTFYLPTVKKKRKHPHAKCKNPTFAPLRHPPLGDVYLRELLHRPPLGDVYLWELLPVEEAVAAWPTVALGGIVKRPQLKNNDAHAPGHDRVDPVRRVRVEDDGVPPCWLVLRWVQHAWLHVNVAWELHSMVKEGVEVGAACVVASGHGDIVRHGLVIVRWVQWDVWFFIIFQNIKQVVVACVALMDRV